MRNHEDSNDLPLHIPHNYSQDYDNLNMQSQSNTATHDDTIVDNIGEGIIIPPKRSTRTNHPPAYLEDFQTLGTDTIVVSSKYPIHNFI